MLKNQGTQILYHICLINCESVVCVICYKQHKLDISRDEFFKIAGVGGMY